MSASNSFSVRVGDEYQLSMYKFPTSFELYKAKCKQVLEM